MPLKAYLIEISIGSVLAFLSFLAIIFYTDPYKATLLTHFAFYSSVFIWVTGLFIVIAFWIKTLYPKSLLVNSFWVSIRQGSLVGLMAASSLMLQSQDLLKWWVFLILVLFLTCVELVFTVK